MISPTLTSSATSSVAGAAASSPQAQAVLSSDFETFIQMLTTQAKYQDPLEPLDSSEYAAQLAQFSMVEQQVLSNDLLTALTSQAASSDMGQMSGWIGMEGRTAEAVPFDINPITVYPTVPIGAQAMTLVTYNDAGVEVARDAIPVSSDPVIWSGLTEGGGIQPVGLYRFEVEATGTNGITLPSAQAQTYARIVEISSVSGEARVIFSGGAEVSAGSITALREATTNPLT